MSRALTVIAEIDPVHAGVLADRLAEIREAVDANPVLRPAELPDTHFTRWLILGDDQHELPAVLIWESNHDGPTLDYLEAVVAAAPDGLDRLFGCCVGYPGPAVRVPEEIVAWLRARTVRSQAFFTAYRGHTRRRVVDDTAVRDVLRDILDQDREALIGLTPDAIRRILRDRVAAHGVDASDDGDGEVALWIKRIAAGALAAVIAIPLLPVLIPAYFLLMRAIQKAEARDFATAYDQPVHDFGHHRFEDRVMQNQLTHVVDVKPGRLRLAVLWLVLGAVDLEARFRYVRGELGGITTIHFARWVILFDRRDAPARRRHRLVFFSNYDGSWDAYLGEFIDRAATGLTAVWSNTTGFPRTTGLFGDGARDEEAFKQWTREHQRPALPGEAQAWWSGVPTLTVGNVRDNIWVRRRLGRRLDDEELTTWLRRL